MEPKVGDIVQGKITAIKDYGAFVELGPQQFGLIHISEISDHYVRDIEDYIEVGDTIDLKVIDIDDAGKISLSYKALYHKKKRYDIQLEIGFEPLKKVLKEWLDNDSDPSQSS
jgi:predicted RNA-binding protein with RPS1 domain